MRHAIIAPLAALLLAACGGAGGEQDRPAPVKHTANGLTVTLPAGWRSATRRLTPNLTDPREVLAVGTFPLRYRRTACAHMPGSALEDLGPRDAFVTLMERGRGAAGNAVKARPTRFGPRLGGPSEARLCVPTARFADHWFTFADRGRYFHALVAFGPKASAATRRRTWAILDGLTVDPDVRPDWTFAG